MLFRPATALMFALAFALSGCDMLGIESTADVAARREADGKAVGGACRHAGRAIEDCYAMNKKAERASVFAGWREMNDYMRENKIDAVSPELSPTEVASKAPVERADDEPEKKPAKADKPAKKHDS